jgi:UDP-N-acetylmuramoyl-tripeptide--D-alanyl-D-alanine ligase
MKVSIEELYSIYLNHKEITTDSRSIKPGCLFFALKGATFNGNAFAATALKNGAAYAVIDDPSMDTQQTLLVQDVLEALQQLALHHRLSLSIPVIGITGTNGKTTTKELISTVLASHFRVTYTQGNLNNHIGVPLTLLSITDNTDIAVVEMGANHPGEIAFLCNLARPDYGLITNIGKAHLEGFGGFDGVIRTKSELYAFLRETHGKAFVNGDNALLMERSSGIERILYGKANSCYASGEMAGADPDLVVKWINGNEPQTIRTNLVGAYNLRT